MQSLTTIAVCEEFLETVIVLNILFRNDELPS